MQRRLPARALAQSKSKYMIMQSSSLPFVILAVLAAGACASVQCHAHSPQQPQNWMVIGSGPAPCASLIGPCPPTPVPSHELRHANLVASTKHLSRGVWQITHGHYTSIALLKDNNTAVIIDVPQAELVQSSGTPRVEVFLSGLGCLCRLLFPACMPNGRSTGSTVMVHGARRRVGVAVIACCASVLQTICSGTCARTTAADAPI